MAYSILLVVSKPNSDNYKDEERWTKSIANLKRLTGKNTNIQSLGENVLLIFLDRTLDPLSDILQAISVNYRYLILNEEIKWIEVSRKV